MHFEKLAQSLRLTAVALFSLFLFACGDGDGPDEIVDPRFANCPGPNCVLNPPPPLPPGAFVSANLLTNASFEGASFLPWINAGFITDGTNPILTNPDYPNDFVNLPVAAAGNSFDVNLSQQIALTDGDSYTLTFRAKTQTGVSKSIVVGIGIYGGSFAADARTVALTEEWLGFSFDLTAPACTSAPAGCRVLFDVGAEVGDVDIDDIKVTPTADPANNLVTNGDFETAGLGDYNSGFSGGTPDPVDGSFTQPAETGNDNFYYVDVLSAGAPFDVNLSQVFTITPGLTYKLTYNARTGLRPGGTPPVTARTMITGLGLNEPPFSADTQTVILLDEWRSYTFEFTPTFGNANSRVLFDMGAAEGPVFIDDVFVSIVE